MTRRTRDRIALSFEGLTDAVTNLTGALILLVALVLGVSHAARVQPGAGEASGETSPDELFDLVTQLKIDIGLVEQDVSRLESEIPALEERVRVLAEKAEAARATEQPPPPLPKTPTAEGSIVL